MRLFILTVSLWALAYAKPEMYRENEDFQFSRSSSDEGSKQGYYGAQRGNMGGNYEKAHNMDSLAQHQMSSLVRQVDGELGDGAKTRTGSVYTAGNSRGIFGSGHYDLSNLKGRNFGEGISYDNSQLQSSSLLSQNSGYSDNIYSSANNARYSASQLNALGYNSASHSGVSSQHASEFDNQQVEGQYSGTDNYEYGAQGASNYKYYSHGGSQGRREYDQSNFNSYDQSNYNTNARSKLVSTTPVRLYVRPGTRVIIPVAAQTYDNAQSQVVQDHNVANSEAELVSNSRQKINVVKPVNNAKHFESSYSYRKEWEKHDSQPSVAIPTENPFPKNSELYEDEQLSHAAEQNYQSEVASKSSHSSNINSAYSSNVNSGYSSGLSENTKTAAANRLRYQMQGSANSATSNAYKLGQHSSDASTNLNSLVDNVNSRPKSYQSSYSYHKSWERRGDPYVIQPTGDVSSSQKSQRLVTASADKNSYSSNQYSCLYPLTNICNEQNLRRKRSYNIDDYQQQLFQPNQQELGQRSQNLNQETQNNWEHLENLGQTPQTQWSNLEHLGQETQSGWDNIDSLNQHPQTSLQDLNEHTQGQLDNLEDLGQQTQNKWDNLESLSQQSTGLEDLGQHSQNQFKNLEDLGQQTQKGWDSLESLSQQPTGLEDLGGQHSQNQFNNLEDLGQQTQNKWDNLESLSQQSTGLEDLGQHSQNPFNNLEDLGQQTQNQWGNLENLVQETEKHDNLENLGQNPRGNLEDLGQQTQKNNDFENVGQETQHQWSTFEELGQHIQNQWGKVEDLGQQTQNKDNLENVGQQTQNQWGKMEDLTQQTQNQWSQFEELGQQNRNQWGKFENLGQETQREWDNFHKFSPHLNSQQTQNTWNEDHQISKVQDQAQNGDMQQFNQQSNGDDFYKTTNFYHNTQQTYNSHFNYDQQHQSNLHQEHNFQMAQNHNKWNEHSNTEAFYQNVNPWDNLFQESKPNYPIQQSTTSNQPSFWDKIDEVISQSDKKSENVDSDNTLNHIINIDQSKEIVTTEKSKEDKNLNKSNTKAESNVSDHKVQNNNNLHTTEKTIHQVNPIDVGRGDIGPEEIPTLSEPSDQDNNKKIQHSYNSFDSDKSSKTQEEIEKLSLIKPDENYNEDKLKQEPVILNVFGIEHQLQLTTSSTKKPSFNIDISENNNHYLSSSNINMKPENDVTTDQEHENIERQNLQQEVEFLPQQINDQVLTDFGQQEQAPFGNDMQIYSQQEFSDFQTGFTDLQENIQKPVRYQNQNQELLIGNQIRNNNMQPFLNQEQTPEISEVVQSTARYNKPLYSQKLDHQNIQKPIPYDIKESREPLNVDKTNHNLENEQSSPKNLGIEESPVEPPEKPGFWKSLWGKTVNAKDKVASWFKS